MGCKTPRARTVLFDLDGTLLDTLEDLANAVNHVLCELDCPPHPLDAYRTLVGSGAAVLIQRALPAERRDQLHAEALERFRVYYSTHINDSTSLYPGVSELLDELTAARVPLGVVSNKPEPMVRVLSEDLLSRWTFGCICGQRAGLPKKPNPAMALLASRILETEPERCLFVGDSDIDIQTGQNANMIPIGVSWGFRGVNELRAAGAADVIHHPLELIRFLESSGKL